MEDWEYIGGTGKKLDVHNGRYCVTPEFPSGTWAYFLTEDTNGDPVFPFMVGSTSKEAQVIPDNNGFVAIVEDTGGGDSGGGSDDPLSLVIGSQPTNATVTSGNTQQFNVGCNYRTRKWYDQLSMASIHRWWIFLVKHYWCK